MAGQVAAISGLFSELRCKSVHMHLVIQVRPRSHRAFNNFADRVDRFAFPDVGAKSVIVGSAWIGNATWEGSPASSASASAASKHSGS
jgi:hypothetical protein